jgi:hypothetical protein
MLMACPAMARVVAFPGAPIAPGRLFIGPHYSGAVLGAGNGLMTTTMMMMTMMDDDDFNLTSDSAA